MGRLLTQDCTTVLWLRSGDSAASEKVIPGALTQATTAHREPPRI